MREKIDQLVNYIKQKENRKKFAPVLFAVGFGLMVASVVLLILSIIGLFLPGFGNIDFFTIFKIAGMGIFAGLVGRQWSNLKVEATPDKAEEETIKLLEAPSSDMLNFEELGEKLELTEKEKVEVEPVEPADSKDLS